METYHSSPTSTSRRFLLVVADRRRLREVLRVGVEAAREPGLEVHILAAYGFPSAWSFPLAGALGFVAPSVQEEMLGAEIRAHLIDLEPSVTRVWIPGSEEAVDGSLAALLGEWSYRETILVSAARDRHSRRRIGSLAEIAGRYADSRSILVS